MVLASQLNRNTEPKEVTAAHELGVILGIKTLNYADILGLFLTIARHSTKEDFEEAIAWEVYLRG